MSLLVENRINHWGKLLFRWIYWHILLRGRRLPVPTLMSMAGKRDVEPMAKSPTEKESVQ
jgi:sulfide:quinone oxidoreductase